MSKSYEDLQIYQKSLDLFLAAHRFAMQLPDHEKYELASQVRRSADSVNSNIVEGYGRRRYKYDFIRFLTYSHASNDETINHLKKIGILYPVHQKEALRLREAYHSLGRQLNQFIKYVATHWKTPGKV